MTRHLQTKMSTPLLLGALDLPHAGGRRRVIVRSNQVGLKTSDHWVVRTAWPRKTSSMMLFMQGIDMAWRNSKKICHRHPGTAEI